jgi:hypothetical protein
LKLEAQLTLNLSPDYSCTVLIQTSSVVSVTAMSFKGTRLTEESLYRTSHTSFVLGDKSFGLIVLEERNFCQSENKNCP